ncbi:helix-turn-helix transcriptional regulator [Nocardia sp. NPDC049707]|uniref:helix-turn-helix transcriptional regulator n=1 Tax=Nocardia sp. NPDC049707 TaxID=3154735 RepID=UPI00343CE5EE
MVSEWNGENCRALRGAFRMTQRQFADKIGVNVRTLKKWEAGKLPGVECQAALDTMLSGASEDVAKAFRRLRPDDPEEDAVDRRQMLALLGGLTAIGLGADIDRAQWLLSGAGRPDSWALERIRSTLHEAMLLDDALGSPAAQGMVVAQQQLTEAMLGDCPAGLRAAMLSLHAEWVGLAGALAWDQNDYVTAARLYNLGRDIAHEAEDSDGAGYMLAGLSQLAIWQGKPRIAVDHAVAARSWVAQSADFGLRAYVAMRTAEAYATAGQRRACLDALEEATRAMDGVAVELSPADSRAYYVSQPFLESYRGQCFSLLGDAAEAVEASRRAIAAIEPTRTRDLALTLLELERALIQVGDIDEAAAVVGQAADLTQRNRSPRLSGAIRDGRKALSPWAGSRAVQDLDARLAARDIVAV